MTRCPACGKTKIFSEPAEFTNFITHYVFHELGRKKTYSAECLSCGMIFCATRFTDQQAKRLYTDYRGEEYTRIRKIHDVTFDVELASKRYSHLSTVERFLMDKLNREIYTVKDIGSSFFTNTLFKDYSLVEKQIEPFETLNFAASDTDGLYQISHVLEHVSNPYKFLLDLKVTRDPKVIYCEVPLENMIVNQSNLSEKQHWHEHINFFTYKSIIRLFKRLNFTLVADIYLPVTLGTNFYYVMGFIFKKET
jgi:hypothetical protein